MHMKLLPGRHERTRRLAAGLGIGSVVFGIGPALVPRLSARLFGLPLADSPAGPVLVRSVGVRDAVIGLGLWSAATHGGNFAPWLLTRFLCDAGDTAAVALAVRGGARDPRMFALGALAAGALAGGLGLYLAARLGGGRR